jgi:RNA polymerase sigma factor (sigma-70 family)
VIAITTVKVGRPAHLENRTEQEQQTDPLKERNELIVKWLPLVHHVYYRLSRNCWTVTNMDRDDAIGAGRLGLVQAARFFDPNFGVKFVTYAYRCVARAIIGASRKHSGVISIPESSFNDSAPDHIKDAVNKARYCIHLSTLSGGMVDAKGVIHGPSAVMENSSVIADVAAPEPEHEAENERSDEIRYMWTLIDKLNEVDRQLLIMRYMDDLTLREISVKFNKTREWARQRIVIAERLVREMADPSMTEEEVPCRKRRRHRARVARMVTVY